MCIMRGDETGISISGVGCRSFLSLSFFSPLFPFFFSSFLRRPSSSLNFFIYYLYICLLGIRLVMGGRLWDFDFCERLSLLIHIYLYHIIHALWATSIPDNTVFSEFNATRC